MKRIANLVEMWLHHGFNYIKYFVIWIFNIINIICNSIRNYFHKCTMKKFNLYCITFVLGIMAGQMLLMNKITDDCRILRATRFGEVYIGCGTAQKL